MENISTPVVLVSVLLCFCSANAKQNWDTPRCKVADLECLPNVITNYIKASATGIKALHLIPVDPLYVPRIDVIPGSKSPVNVELILKNSTIYGLSDLEIKHVVGFDKDPKTSKFELYGFLPKFSLIGKYECKGKVIVLPLVGSGNSNLTFVNLGVSIKFRPKIETKNGKDYANIDQLKLRFNTTRLYVDWENLYNGNKLLGDATNKFINENWLEIFMELRPSLHDIISKIIQSIMEPLFAKYPYAELFAQ